MKDFECNSARKYDLRYKLLSSSNCVQSLSDSTEETKCVRSSKSVCNIPMICDERCAPASFQFEIPAGTMPTSGEYREKEDGTCPCSPVNSYDEVTLDRVTNGVLAQVALAVCLAPCSGFVNYRLKVTLQTSSVTELDAP
jgi:hypothetical protein